MDKFDPAASGKITSSELRRLVLAQPDLPTVLAVELGLGVSLFLPLSTETDVCLKHGQNTAYGDIDLVRVFTRTTPGDDVLMSHALARLLPDDGLPVKLRDEEELAFLIGTDLRVSIEEQRGRPCCTLFVKDTDDA